MQLHHFGSLHVSQFLTLPALSVLKTKYYHTPLQGVVTHIYEYLRLLPSLYIA